MKKIIALLLFGFYFVPNFAQKFEFSTKQENIIQSKYKLDNNTLIPDGIDKESSIIGDTLKVDPCLIFSFGDYISIQGSDKNGSFSFTFDDIVLLEYALEDPSFEKKEIGIEIYDDNNNVIGTIWVAPEEITIWHSPEDIYNFTDRFQQCFLRQPIPSKLNSNKKSYDELKKNLRNYHGKTQLKKVSS